MSASLHLNGVNQSGCCLRTTVIETVGGGPPRDAVALALERHKLRKELVALEKWVRLEERKAVEEELEGLRASA